MQYPAAFSIETPDGAGEATKQAQGEPWVVSYPTGGFRWHGSVPQVRAEVRNRLRAEHGRGYSVLFGEPGTTGGK